MHTTVCIKKENHKKLAKLAASEKRTLAGEIDYLVSRRLQELEQNRVESAGV